MIRMITSDMDGTLLTGGKWDERRLPLDFEEVLGRLEQAGIHFLAASGRTYPSVRANFGKLADRVDYICDNGGCLVCDGKVVHVEQIVPELAENCTSWCRVSGLASFPVAPKRGPICWEEPRGWVRCGNSNGLSAHGCLCTHRANFQNDSSSFAGTGCFCRA